MTVKEQAEKIIELEHVVMFLGWKDEAVKQAKRVIILADALEGLLLLCDEKSEPTDIIIKALKQAEEV